MLTESLLRHDGLYRGQGHIRQRLGRGQEGGDKSLWGILVFPRKVAAAEDWCVAGKLKDISQGIWVVTESKQKGWEKFHFIATVVFFFPLWVLVKHFEDRVGIFPSAELGPWAWERFWISPRDSQSWCRLVDFWVIIFWLLLYSQILVLQSLSPSCYDQLIAVTTLSLRRASSISEGLVSCVFWVFALQKCPQNWLQHLYS